MTKVASSSSAAVNRVVSALEGAPRADPYRRDQDRADRFGTGAGLSRDETGLGDGSTQDQAFHQHGDDPRARSFQDRIADAVRKSDTSPRPALHRSKDADTDGHADGTGLALPSPFGFAVPRSPRDDPEQRGSTRADRGPSSALQYHPPGDRDETAMRAAESKDVLLATPTPSEPRRARVLASVEPSADSLASLFKPQPQPVLELTPAGETPSGARQESRVAQVAARIEDAVRAELRAGAGQPIHIDIPIDAEIDGLKGLSVVISSSGIDIVLERQTDAAPSRDLTRAAQWLAETLQRRVGKGTVRVLDVAAARDEGETAPAGFEGQPVRSSSQAG